MYTSQQQDRVEAAKKLQEKLRKLAEEGGATQESRETSPPVCVEDVLRIAGHYSDAVLTYSTP